MVAGDVHLTARPRKFSAESPYKHLITYQLRLKRALSLGLGLTPYCGLLGILRALFTHEAGMLYELTSDWTTFRLDHVRRARVPLGVLSG